jgi:glycosyltransferase involved in cell wall biosynthesis
MNVLHIITSLDPELGGPAEGVRLLLSETSDRWTGEVVTLDDPSAPFLSGFPFPVHALGPASGTVSFTRKLYPWLRANRHRFDGFLINGLWQCGLATMLAARRSTPYMVFAHGMLDPYFKRSFPIKHIKKALYWYPVEYWVLRNAFRVLFTTEPERTLAERSFAFWKWKSAIVPYSVHAPELPVQTYLDAFHIAVPELKGRRFVVFLGRIDPKKGCDLLVKAFCEIASDDPELHLLMAGPSDAWAQQLQAIAEAATVADRVHWPGMLRGPAKWGAFIASETFILPSHQENFGIAVAEALACGRPVLLSDQVNIGSIIGDAGCSLIEPDTLEGTRSLLRRWISLNAEERANMSAAAGLCFHTRFDLRSSVEQLVQLFEEARSTFRPRMGPH